MGSAGEIGEAGDLAIETSRAGSATSMEASPFNSWVSCTPDDPAYVA